MEISSIILLLRDYIMLAVVLLIFLGILFFVGYRIIYKKVMNGKKTISKKRLVLYSISIFYIIIVLGAVFLNRTELYGDVNLHLFSSYKEAYNKMEISLFRNIVLNILLFVPLGFLLPIYSDKLKKSYIVILIGFLFTLGIELIQYVTRIGIFEIDDIFNNTLGVIIGYSAFIIYNSLRNKEKRKYIALYVLPIIFTIFAFLGIYIKYKNQEMGNLPIDYNYKVNMKNINIEKECDFSNETTNKDIFYKENLTEDETRKMAEEIFEKLGTKIDENRTIIYEDTAIYYSDSKKEESYSLWIDYRGGTYTYTDFSRYSKSENENKTKEESNAREEEVQKALEKIGIKLPENCIFENNGNGRYTFSVDMELEEDKLIDGSLSCLYHDDKKVKNIINNIIQYKKIGNKQIISEEEAYNEILEGKFGYNEYNVGKIKDIIIENVRIGYYLDTKGYYVPIYIFSCKINGRTENIDIKAIKE